MYQNYTNQNPLVSQFNGYMANNPNVIPFQHNQLINNNVHVMNNLNNNMQEYRMMQQTIPIYAQPNMNITNGMANNMQNNKAMSNITKGKNILNSNIIEEMLKPVKIKKDGNTRMEVDSNYAVRKDVQKKAKKGKVNIAMTNAPYKNIIKDKIVMKKVEDVTESDIVVHRVIKGVDNNREEFDKKLEKIENEKDQINAELKLEFHIDNYDQHKKKFEFKESFIKNLPYEQNTFDDNKRDYIDFYKQKQKEEEEGIKVVDEVLKNLYDEGMISKDELPTDFLTDSKQDIQKKRYSSVNNIDINTIVSNIKIDDIYTSSSDRMKNSSKPSVTTSSIKPSSIKPSPKPSATTSSIKPMSVSKNKPNLYQQYRSQKGALGETNTGSTNTINIGGKDIVEI